MQQTEAVQEQPRTSAIPRPHQVTDLSDPLATWLRRAREMAVERGQKMLAEAVENLEHRRAASYRLVVVGEHNTGKSRLVNRLLGRQVAPEGIASSTVRPLHLVASSRGEELVVRHRDGEKKQALDVEATRRSLGEDSDGVTRVEARIGSKWLRKLRAEILDTPGILRPDTETSLRIGDELNEADVALLVISGLYPMSLAEARFLEEHILGRHIPHVLVLVTMLDRVAEGERADVLAAIVSKVEDVASSIDVLPTHPVETAGDADKTLEAVRQRIEAMTRRESRAAWRGWQIAAQLIEILERLKEAGEQAMSRGAADARRRDGELRRRRQALKEFDRQWEEVRLELGKRHLELSQTLRQRLETSKAEVVKRLEYDLSRAGDPKVWWERDLPYRLRQEMGAAARGLESTLTKALTRDAQELERHLAKTFKQPQAGRFTVSSELDEPRADLPSPRLANLEIYRLGARLGTGVGLVAGATLFSSVAGAVVAAGVIMAIAGEQVLKHVADQQRARASEAMVPVVERALEAYQVQLGQHLREVYDRLIDHAMERRTIWRQAQREDLAAKQAPLSSREEASWRQTIGDVEALIEEIYAVLEAQIAHNG